MMDTLRQPFVAVSLLAVACRKAWAGNCFSMDALFRQLAILLLPSVIALLASTAQADTLNIRLILNDGAPIYQQFSVAFRSRLAASKVSVDIIESKAAEIPKPGEKPVDLVIAAGPKAIETAIANFDAPILSLLVYRTVYESLIETHSRSQLAKAVSAIYLDQPWGRQLSFIQAAIPGDKVVGLLYSPHTTMTLPRLPRGVSVNAQSVRSIDALFPTLENVLNNSDVLLVIPDNEIYSSNNMRNILMASYRTKIPIIGISQAYVNAGALCAIFSTPEQVADQAEGIVTSFARSRRLQEPQYPLSFSISVNPPVARTLGMELTSPEVIRERMDKSGDKR